MKGIDPAEVVVDAEKQVARASSGRVCMVPEQVKLFADVLLDIIDDAMTRHPRIDPRTTNVHFANSTEDQIARIARFGAIVSANAYCPVGFADKYSEYGLGADRADAMERSESVRASFTVLGDDPYDVANFLFDHIAEHGFAA